MFKKKVKVTKQEPVEVIGNPIKELVDETTQEQQIHEEPIQEQQIYEEQMPKAPQEIKERWKVGEVATETERVLHDSKTGKSYDIYSAIALILNKAYEV